MGPSRSRNRPADWPRAVHAKQIAVLTRVVEDTSPRLAERVIGRVQNWHTPRRIWAQKQRFARFGDGLDLGDGLDAGGPAVLFELVLQDLSIEGAAADLEHARRLFLVPRHRFEHALDVGT